MNTPQDALAISAAGAIALVFAGWPILKARRARRWPTAKATVLKTKVVQTAGGESDRPAGMRIEVTYRYSVGGNSYTCDRLDHFRDSGGDRSRKAAEKFRKRFSQGSAIRVHYDPGDPAQSTTDTNVPGGYYFVACLGALFFVSGVAMLLVLSSRASVTG